VNLIYTTVHTGTKGDFITVAKYWLMLQFQQKHKPPKTNAIALPKGRAFLNTKILIASKNHYLHLID